MHLRTSSGVNTDACASPHMTGIQYVASGTCKVNGGATINLNTVTTAQSVKINLTDSSTSVTTESAVFWAFDGSTDATAPVTVTAYGAEQGDAAWTACGGVGNAVSLTDQTAAISHDYYVLMSASPDTVGSKTSFAWKIQVDYY
jgi:type 1 fimbria pilin